MSSAKTLYIAVLSILIYNSALSQNPINQLNQYKQHCDQDFYYIQTDRPFYEPNEQLWFTAWVINSGKLNPSKSDFIITVNLKNAKGEIIKSNKQYLNGYCASGTFILPEKGGLYYLEVQSDYHSQFYPNIKHSKEIQIQNIEYSPILFENKLDKNAYMLNDSLILKIIVKNYEGDILPNANAVLELYSNNSLYNTYTLKTNNEGKIEHSIRLPNDSLIFNLNLVLKINYANQYYSKYINIPLSETIYDLQFLPESGHLIQGIKTQLAFKAVNYYGKPVKVKGIIYNQNHDSICSFETEHNGMGKIDFTPDQTTYYAKHRSNQNIQTCNLPKVAISGSLINVLPIHNDSIAISIKSTDTIKKHLILRKANDIYLNQIVLNQNENIVLCTKPLPMGVYQLTLFDDKWQHICQRLVFVQLSKQMNVSMNFDQKIHAPKDNEKMNIKVLDENKQAVEGVFSFSVVNEQMLQYSEQYRENMLSKMLLQNELKSEVHFPSYYFTDANHVKLKQLDLVMLTNGWSRIDWDSLKSNNKEIRKRNNLFLNERYVIRGNINSDKLKMKDEKHVKLIILNNHQNIPIDSQGNFTVWGINNNDEIKLKVKFKHHFRKIYKIKPWILLEKVSQEVNAVKYIDLKDSATKLALLDEKKSKEIKTKSAMLESDEKYKSIVVKKEENKLTIKNDVKLNEESDVHSLRGVDIKANSNSSITESSSKMISQSRLQRTYFNYIDVYGININSNKLNYDDLLYINFNYKNSYQYYTPLYSQYNSNSIYNKKNDLRKTLTYLYDVKTNSKGEAELNFTNSSENGSFVCQLEGISNTGKFISYTTKYSVIKPYIITKQIPENLTAGDSISVLVNIENNTNSAMYVYSTWILENKKNVIDELTIPAGKIGKLNLPLIANIESGTIKSLLKININGETEEFNNTINVKPKLFKTIYTKSNQSGKYHYKIYIDSNSAYLNTSKLTLDIQSSSLKKLTNSISAMVREPHGCFEQVSSSNYPNILIYKLLQSKNNYTELQSIKEKLLIGYQKLAAYETKEKGFEWYGNTPPHEGLTAYGLLQFHEMKDIIDMDSNLNKRTMKWLLTRYNKDGSINVNRGKYGFSGASEPVTNAYVTWVLSEIKNTIDLSPQIKHLENELAKKYDTYLSILLSNIYFNTNQKEKGKKLLSRCLIHAQSKNFNNMQANHSIVNSYGNYLDIELIGMLAYSMLKNEHELEHIDAVHSQLIKRKSNYGLFGTTQSTIWALKSMILYDNHLKTRFNNMIYSEQESIDLKLNGVNIFNRNSIIDQFIDLPTELLKTGENNIEINFAAKENKLFTLNLEYLNIFPGEQSKLFKLSNHVENKIYNIGDYVPINYEYKNLRDTGLGQTLIVIPLTGNLALIPEQLKLLKDKKNVDYYEIFNGNLVLYFAEIGPKEVKNINISYLCQVSGKSFMPPAYIYLYYNKDDSYYCYPNQINIK